MQTAQTEGTPTVASPSPQGEAAAPPALSAVVEGAPAYQGLRVDHPRLWEYAKNAVKLGWSNERIIQVIGLPQEVVEKVRQAVKKEQGKK